MSEVIRLDFTVEEARGITDKIKSDVSAWSDRTSKLAEILREAKARNAHKILGYRTWATYVEAEFGMKARNSQYIMNGRPSRAIEKRAPGAENAQGSIENTNPGSENVIEGEIVKSASERLTTILKAFELEQDNILSNGIDSEDIENCNNVLYALATRYRETKNYLNAEASAQDTFAKVPKNAADELGTKPLTDENKPEADIYY